MRSRTHPSPQQPPPWCRGLAVASICALWPAWARAEAPVCRAAADTQERAHAIPDHLLRSIAAVESAGHPWSVNADGVGRSFASKQDAIAFVQQAQYAGARYIDVGCFQIDLFFHPEAFADLQQAFDPGANAAYAARFLSSLHADAGDWGRAVGAYHSQDAALGSAYRSLVYAASDWPGVAKTVVMARLWFGMRVVVPGAATLDAPPAARLPRVFVP